MIGVVLALVGAITGALSVIFNKQASTGLHNSVVGFWYLLSNVLLCPIWSFVEQRKEYPIYCWELLGFYVGIGVLFFLMQSLMCYAMRFMPGAMAGVLIYVAIPVSYALDVIFIG